MDQLFSSALLDIAVPDTSLEFPPTSSTDEWLSRIKSGDLERKQAFFDEQLHSFLLVQIECSGGNDPTNPPKDLLAFLAHLQISLEASYISAEPTPLLETPRTSLLSAPHRMSKLNPNSARQPPSIIPPSTPNPMPSSAEPDKKYARSEGTLLNTLIWGQEISDDPREAFCLLYSDQKNAWIAVYKLSLTVSFLKVSIEEPLLCLTVSTTLRDKPLALPPKHPLAVFMASIGEASALVSEPTSTSTNGPVETSYSEPQLEGFEEVNLLDGLLGGLSFAPNETSSALYLPTSRLGPISRQKLFSLPAIVPPTPVMPSPSPMTVARVAHPTLRKSYRKTLNTVSGFRVRMRTVFVPAVLLPSLIDRSREFDDLDPEEERERREAGNEERTVVLCVEIENSGESGSNVAFVVERVDVKVTGEGSKTTLIGWGADFHHQKHPKQQLKHLQSTFPMIIGSREQYNLLYAVSFLRSPEEVEGLMNLSAPALKAPSAGGTVPSDPDLSLQRAVSIVIHGKPCLRPFSASTPPSEHTSISYPTDTFSSRWNCILDLSLPSSRPPPTRDPETQAQTPGGGEVLPAPASPFPVTVTSPPNGSASTLNPRRSSLVSPSSSLASAQMTPSALSALSAGSKRHTMPSAGITSASRGMRSSGLPPMATNYRASTSAVPTRSMASAVPPSIALQIPKSPTTYDPPQSRPPSPPGGGNDHVPPMTPAYPAWNHGINEDLSNPPTPMSQGPLASQMKNYIGPSVEIKRERGPEGFTGNQFGPLPSTPGPVVGFGQGEGIFGQQQSQNGFFGPIQDSDDDSIVVSVGLLPLRKSPYGGEPIHFTGKIHPLSYFTLDIFVFNRSARTRRFEISCPDMRRQMRKTKREMDGLAYRNATALKMLSREMRMLTDCPGILPLENRVRIGPLLPSACQSVRMEFIAITPGVHSVNTLTLTDIESGFSMNLRSVMDIVVHEIDA